MRHICAAVVAVALIPPFTTRAPYAAPAAAAPVAGATIAQFLAPGYPTEMVAARKADRIAWTAYEHGQRNVYTAAAPDFRPCASRDFSTMTASS